jgi:4a-hydroxytetrahydrobiopterin dehydratase
MSDTRLTHDDIDAADLADWRLIMPALQTRFRTGNFATGLRLVNLIGEAAEQANHHPDLDLRYGHLNIRLYSHDASGVTERDIALARKISELAAGVGAIAEPTLVSAMLLALDTPDYARIKPFWRAALGYRDTPQSDDQMQNDDGDLPAIWFQTSGSDEPRQRWHLDVIVPRDVAQSRIDAAIAAGGEIASRAPTFVALSDPDGNKVCICD